MRRVNNERIKGVVGDEKRRMMVGEEWEAKRERMVRPSSSTCSLHVVSRETRFSFHYYYMRE